MRVLAEMGLLLVLGLVVGLRSDVVFIAGLLLAVSVAGLVEWLRPAHHEGTATAMTRYAVHKTQDHCAGRSHSTNPATETANSRPAMNTPSDRSPTTRPNTATFCGTMPIRRFSA